jgi:antagonist of KipI
MSIRILKAGMFDTIQDNGRIGYGRWGINSGGVMDMYASDIANALVGNDSSCAVLEMHFPAAEILFLEETLVSITGADFSLTLNGSIPLPTWKTLIIPAQSVLSFKRPQKGARVYLAAHGGFGVDEWLGSRSTNVKSGVGGFRGRRLLKDDEIEVNGDTHLSKRQLHVFPWSVNTKSVYQHTSIGLLKGHEFDWLSDQSSRVLTESEFSIHSSSDRMAFHLVHEMLQFEKKQELFSSAVSFGTTQLLPSGKLLTLMADHQTTGGYPRIGHVASAFLPIFSQISAGEKFRFHWITSAEAEKMLFSLRTEMNTVRNMIREKLQSHYA